MIENFVHRFEPGVSGDPRTLLLLHGTGGNEDSMLPLASALAPNAAVLSPRGRVLERGMPRFFRRLAEGVFDIPDLIARTEELGTFVEEAIARYSLDPEAITAVGFSNGANIAASLLLLRPRLLKGAVLFRAMVPLEPDQRPALTGTPVLLSEGRFDPLVPQSNAERLAELLRAGGANVTLNWWDAGHELARGEVERATEWLQGAERVAG
jgi:phospholipase/carboxylesterase